MQTTLVISKQSGTSSMRTSTVRKRILEEHRVLRDKLDVLELLIDGLSEDPKRCSAVSRSARDVKSSRSERSAGSATHAPTWSTKNAAC